MESLTDGLHLCFLCVKNENLTRHRTPRVRITIAEIFYLPGWRGYVQGEVYKFRDGK